MNQETLTDKKEEKTCSHGNRYYCGLCKEAMIPKCKHGNSHFCGLCYTKDKTNNKNTQ